MNSKLGVQTIRNSCQKLIHAGSLLGAGLGVGEEWEQDYCPGTSLLALFGFEGTCYWTVLSDKPQEFAPIYIRDEPNFDTASPSYPSLTAMLEEWIPRLKFVWKID